MRKLAWTALVAAGIVLPACTTFNPQRRTMTDWSWSMLHDKPDPCGTMSDESCGERMGRADRAGNKAVDLLLVKPIALATLPISWLTDTLILNPIDGYKKAELDTYERKTCQADCQHWSNPHADHHSWGVLPGVTPWPVGWVLTAPEFAGRWVWNSVTPTDPTCKGCYEDYWREHNESTGE